MWLERAYSEVRFSLGMCTNIKLSYLSLWFCSLSECTRGLSMDHVVCRTRAMTHTYTYIWHIQCTIYPSPLLLEHNIVICSWLVRVVTLSCFTPPNSCRLLRYPIRPTIPSLCSQCSYTTIPNRRTSSICFLNSITTTTFRV